MNSIMNKQIGVTEWVAMFEGIGLDHGQMDKWHKLFEARHPADHQRFLEWLGLNLQEIDRVRGRSR